jgi:hypothetical protein
VSLFKCCINKAPNQQPCLLFQRHQMELHKVLYQQGGHCRCPLRPRRRSRPKSGEQGGAADCQIVNSRDGRGLLQIGLVCFRCARQGLATRKYLMKTLLVNMSNVEQCLMLYPMPKGRHTLRMFLYGVPNYSIPSDKSCRLVFVRNQL